MRWFERLLSFWKRHATRSLAIGSAIGAAGGVGAAGCESPMFASRHGPLGYLPSHPQIVPASPHPLPHPATAKKRAARPKKATDEWDWDGSQSSARDVDDSTAWRGAVDELAIRLAPEDDRWLAYYVPTLFAALANPAEGSLRASIKPALSEDMTQAFERARRVKSALTGRLWSRDQAMLIDLPGPEATAFAAVFADRCTPVFAFDNLPHPAAVVPSEETLGAVLYYLPMFERGQRDRVKSAKSARPMFVFDGNRDLSYTDDADVFDNRSSAKVPDAASLMRLGIHRVLYVTADEVRSVDVRELEDFGEIFWDTPQVDSDDGPPQRFAFVDPTGGSGASISLGTLWWTEGGVSDGWVGSSGGPWVWGGRSGSLGRFHSMGGGG